MGQSESSQSQLKYNRQINHPKFRQAKIIKQQNIIRNIMHIDNESDYRQWENNITKISNINQQVLLLPKAYQYERKTLCGESGQLEIAQIDYDDFKFILLDELKNRQKVCRHFEEVQVWYILYSLVQSACDFQSYNCKIGDVRPQNIFVSEDGHIKISNLFSWPLQFTNYTKTLTKDQVTYVSPEQLQSIKKAKAAKTSPDNQFIDKYKAQSFSIGLTILESATLFRISQLYLCNNQFDMGRLQNIMKQWCILQYRRYTNSSSKEQFKKAQYSDILKVTIIGMCQVSAQNRLTSRQVYQFLRPFKQQINSLNQFYHKINPNVFIYANNPNSGLNNFNKKLQAYTQFLNFWRSSTQSSNRTNSHPYYTSNPINQGGSKILNANVYKNIPQSLVSQTLTPYQSNNNINPIVAQLKRQERIVNYPNSRINQQYLIRQDSSGVHMNPSSHKIHHIHPQGHNNGSTYLRSFKNQGDSKLGDQPVYTSVHQVSIPKAIVTISTSNVNSNSSARLNHGSNINNPNAHSNVSSARINKQIYVLHARNNSQDLPTNFNRNTNFQFSQPIIQQPTIQQLIQQGPALQQKQIHFSKNQQFLGPINNTQFDLKNVSLQRLDNDLSNLSKMGTNSLNQNNFDGNISSIPYNPNINPAKQRYLNNSFNSSENSELLKKIDEQLNQSKQNFQ